MCGHLMLESQQLKKNAFPVAQNSSRTVDFTFQMLQAKVKGQTNKQKHCLLPLKEIILLGVKKCEYEI